MISPLIAREEAVAALSGAVRMGRRVWVAATWEADEPIQRFLAALTAIPVMALTTPASLALLAQEGDVLVLPPASNLPEEWQRVALARKLRCIIFAALDHRGPFDILLPQNSSELAIFGTQCAAVPPQLRAKKFFTDWLDLRSATVGLRPLVFTNGVFDILHRGHIHSLQAARNEGSYLVVGVNSDASVRRLGKGRDRPIQTETDRAALLAALECVDFVTIFEEDTPARLIEMLRPDVLVKGGDYQSDQIAGADFVIGCGGRVVTIAFEHDRSTTQIIKKIRANG